MISKNELGSIMLSDEAMKDIVRIVVEKFNEFSSSKKGNSFINITDKNDEVVIRIRLKIKQGEDVANSCKQLQKEVHNAIEDMSGIDVKTINIEIEGFTY